jgi:hypothetical protein
LTATHKLPQFASIPRLLLEFAQAHDFQAEAKRRNNTAQAAGFRLADAREHLIQNVPGLYEYGFSEDSVHRLMTAPNKQRVAAKLYYGAVGL